MSTPTSQLLSPSSASPDHFTSAHQHQQPAGQEPNLLGFSELQTVTPESQLPLNNSLCSLKTEYKSKFTPFDQYVYNELTDSFVRPPSASPVAPSLTDHLLLTPRTGANHNSPDVQPDLCSRASSTEQPVAPAAEPWYKEVQRRNEKANEYRFKSEVGHGSATQTAHCRDDYKRDHLISHLANNNNFNLPKDTSTSASRSAHNRVTSARSVARTPAQARSKSQSTVRRAHPPPTTTASSATTKNLNLTPTRAPDRHLGARPSPHLTSSSARNSKNNHSLDTRKPLSTSSRTTTRLTAGHPENQARLTSSSAASSAFSKRPATGTIRVSLAPRQTSRQPLTSSSPAATAQRNYLSTNSTAKTLTTTQKLSHSKNGTSTNRTSASSTSTPAVKSIKTPQAVEVATVASGAAIAAAVLATSDSSPSFQSTDLSTIKVEPKEEVPMGATDTQEVTSSPQRQPLEEEFTTVKIEPDENSWTPTRNLTELAEPNNFMFSNTETGNMLADELAEAELNRQKTDTFSAMPDDQSYQTNESDNQHKSTVESLQVSKDDEENQMYSIMPIAGETLPVSKSTALEPMSESLEALESYQQSPETEPKPMDQILIGTQQTESSDEIAIDEPLKPKSVEHEQKQDELVDDYDIAMNKEVAEATDELLDTVQSSKEGLDRIEPDRETKPISDTATIVTEEEEESSKPINEVYEPIQMTTPEVTRQDSDVSANDKINSDEQSHTEDDLSKQLINEDVANLEVPLHQHNDEQEHDLLETNVSKHPHASVISESSQKLDSIQHDLINDESGNHSNESHVKQALPREDLSVEFPVKNNVDYNEEPGIEREIKSELLMDVNNLLDEEARKKLEMSMKSELARKSSSPLTDVGEVLLSPIQLDLLTQDELKKDKFIEDQPILETLIDQRGITPVEREEKSNNLLDGEPQKVLQQQPVDEVNLSTTSENSVGKPPLDDNTFVGDTNNDWKQEKIEMDERERSVGDELSGEESSAMKDTDNGIIGSVDNSSQSNLIGLGEFVSDLVKSTEKEAVNQAAGLTEVTDAAGWDLEGTESDSKPIEEDFAMREEEETSNALRRKLSSRSSSSTSSSHTSSSASSSLERVVQNDIKSDYEELAARMTTDLISNRGGEGAGFVTSDILTESSPETSQSSVAKVTATTAHQQLADGFTATTTTTTTNLLD